MATSLQQLLDALADRTAAPITDVAIEDATGALAHLGRALAGMTHDGLTAGVSRRQQTAAQLTAACTTVGRLWPRTGGPLTDLAGAAADVIGRDRASMGRAHRWAVTVELAEAADHCARLAHRLLPHAAVAELAAVHRLAVAVERDAQGDPPTASGAAVLNRLVPVSGLPRAGERVTAVDAAAALTAALDRALRTDGLTLREFRAAVAAAEITSDSAASVVAAAAGDEGMRPLLTAVAWELTGRISMTFEDGHRARPTDPHGVVPWARSLADTLCNDVGSNADLSALRDRGDLPRLTRTVQEVSNQLPVLADRLVAGVDRWSRTGRLYAAARDLPRMDNMPEDRVREVIAGRRVQARGADLDRLRRALASAGALSSSLADAVNRAVSPAAPSQRHLAGLYAERARAPGRGERLLSHADNVAEAIAGSRCAPITTPAPGAGGTGRY
ncbi:conserved protein of unknown function [Blastococcus saxobsidens DD2]|uniref:Uncharacterized protein n=1 Tax=Blastococcus saxobsidens (strain DD2) TaxID=1146883 RepID=H6RKL4_BLASD|nr:conserved protein of unknown function [Blastococcus saxobsidens DD2]